MANVNGNSINEVFPKVRQNTERTYGAKQTGTMINKTNRRRTRDTYGLSIINLGDRKQCLHQRHGTHHVYGPNRTIPSGVKSGKQIHHGAVQNRWEPNPC